MTLESRTNYPNDPKRGFDFDQIFQDYKTAKAQRRSVAFGSLYSATGRRINYGIHRHNIWVRDADMQERDMVATAHTQPDSNVAWIDFALHTKISALDPKQIEVHKIYPWVRHPDFFGRVFINIALEHFNREGFNVIACQGVWWPGSINYQGYQIAKEKIGDLRLAAKSTWSGEVFSSLGYTDAEVTKDQTEEVQVNFYNPSIVANTQSIY